MTGIGSLSTIRRALEGLLVKLSIEREVGKNGNRKRENATAYRVFTPAEVIARRKEKGAMSRGPEPGQRTEAFARAVARVADNARLSRREAQVALCCVEGLTNAEIGKRLAVSEQTVKFHLRNVFLKSGVKRRAELIARLLM
jgi:DNA-binding CsgD family transcriptional regulator